jgi:hypothetical protein
MRVLTPEICEQLEDDVWYEICPKCKGRGELCRTCWDLRVVPHEDHDD